MVGRGMVSRGRGMVGGGGVVCRGRCSVRAAMTDFSTVSNMVDMGDRVGTDKGNQDRGDEGLEKLVSLR